MGLNRNQNLIQMVLKASVHVLGDKSFMCCMNLEMPQYSTQPLPFVWFSLSLGLSHRQDSTCGIGTELIACI